MREGEGGGPYGLSDAKAWLAECTVYRCTVKARGRKSKCEQGTHCHAGKVDFQILCQMLSAKDLKTLKTKKEKKHQRLTEFLFHMINMKNKSGLKKVLTKTCSPHRQCL